MSRPLARSNPGRASVGYDCSANGWLAANEGSRADNQGEQRTNSQVRPEAGGAGNRLVAHLVGNPHAGFPIGQAQHMPAKTPFRAI